MAKTAAAAAAPAAPETVEATSPPLKKGKKKLIIIIAGALFLLAVVGGGVAFYLKKKAAAEAAEQEEGSSSQDEKLAHGPKVDLNHPPVFVPLEPFVVNLADKESDRYAQIAVTLQVEDAKFAEKMKAFMPAIRNSILMVLTHKTSHDLLERSGKQALAEEIMREAARPMGIHIDAPVAKDAGHTTDKAEDPDEDIKKKKKKVAKEEVVVNPIQQVHFANFIVQ